MIHRTFRSLDQAPKLVGFTLRQWVALIACSGAVFGLIHLAQLPTKPAITLCVFAVGLPGALTYVSESGGLQLGQLLGDMCRWRLHSHTRAPARSECTSARGLIVLAQRGEQAPQDAFASGEQALEELLLEERWKR